MPAFSTSHIGVGRTHSTDRLGQHTREFCGTWAVQKKVKRSHRNKRLCVCSFASVSISLSVWLSACLTICPSVCLSVCLRGCLNDDLFVCLSAFHKSDYLLVSVYVCVFCLSVCLTVGLLESRKLAWVHYENAYHTNVYSCTIKRYIANYIYVVLLPFA